jgi:hypothetical protein
MIATKSYEVRILLGKAVRFTYTLVHRKYSATLSILEAFGIGSLAGLTGGFKGVIHYQTLIQLHAMLHFGCCRDD